MKNLSFRAHGKLLLTAEYFVLDGATALAVPTLPGQHMTVAAAPGDRQLHWKSIDADGSLWFEATFSLPDIEVRGATDENIAATLRQLLLAARHRNPAFLTDDQSLDATTTLEFPRNWGLGSSSTLIYMLSQWSETNPYQLLAATMGGSGYDIACAAADSPVLYILKEGVPMVTPVFFRPSFSEHLYFVYLGKKQNSREGIAKYRSSVFEKEVYAERFSALTAAFLQAADLVAFDALIREHEELIASLLGLVRAKDRYFKDFEGEIKSLGAWGGDFVLVTSARSLPETKAYFKNKGFEVCLRYDELVIGAKDE